MARDTGDEDVLGVALLELATISGGGLVDEFNRRLAICLRSFDDPDADESAKREIGVKVSLHRDETGSLHVEFDANHKIPVRKTSAKSFAMRTVSGKYVVTRAMQLGLPSIGRLKQTRVASATKMPAKPVPMEDDNDVEDSYDDEGL